MTESYAYNITASKVTTFFRGIRVGMKGRFLGSPEFVDYNGSVVQRPRAGVVVVLPKALVRPGPPPKPNQVTTTVLRLTPFDVSEDIPVEPGSYQVGIADRQGRVEKWHRVEVVG
ncbi:hypothetical protein NR798_00870 [Archangium gephyra]|uniref:hypothetical protein n=1 Tax=Archangium gephyra TaxID=48 RepID=UPI0035D4862E